VIIILKGLCINFESETLKKLFRSTKKDANGSEGCSIFRNFVERFVTGILEVMVNFQYVSHIRN
jgi:hypothetical protein